MASRLFTVLFAFACAATVCGSPLSDLGSPSQQTRDAAAGLLRSSFAAPPRAKWDPIVSRIVKGMTKKEVIALLPNDIIPEGGNGGGGSYSESYRLDDGWMLTCWFRQADDSLIERELSASLRYVWVEPPKDFSGTWVIYSVNGRKSHEIQYFTGKYHGEFIAFYDTGSKCYVQHYDHGTGEGADTGYYPTGEVKYRGAYKAGRRVGVWNWYQPDGSVSSTKTFSE